MTLSQETLDAYFICPKCCTDKLELSDDAESIRCISCATEYPVIENIPVLIVEERVPENFLKQTRYFEKAAEGISVNLTVSPWQQKYITEFCQHLPEEPRVILDNGTGSGYMTIALTDKCQTIMACDLTMANLVLLRRKLINGGGYDNVILCCCSSDNLPFKAKLFDGCVMNAVIEHIPDEKRAIGELGRTICENGVLMIVVPLKYRFLNPLLVPLNMIFDRMIGHLRRYDERSIKKAFGEFFELSKIWYTGHTMKVIKATINILKPIFNEKKIEVEDNKKEVKKWFASNVAAILRRS